MHRFGASRKRDELMQLKFNAYPGFHANFTMQSSGQQVSNRAFQWLTSTRKSSSIGNPSTVFFCSISTDGCRAARPLDLVLVDWDWVTWTWTDPSPNQGEDKVCNVIYDIIFFDIGFLFIISIYISNSSLSDSVLSSWRTSSSLSCSGL